MYLYHRYIDEDFAGISDLSLSPLLAATGEAFEASQLRHLLEAQIYSVGPADSEFSFDEEWTDNPATDLERLETLIRELANGSRTRSIVFFQPSIHETVGAWPVYGDADIVIATINGSTSRPQPVDIRVIEIKSSSAVKTHHQLQAATYSLLFESLLNEIDTNITASIVSQDPEQSDLAALITKTDDLTWETHSERLLEQPNTLTRSVAILTGDRDG